MLSTLKLLSATLLVSTVLSANTNDKVEDFLEESFSKNPNVKELDVHVVDSISLQKPRGWKGLIVDVKATLHTPREDKKIKQKMVWFSNGEVIAKELLDLETGLSLRDSVTPSFHTEYYKKENLIYGDINAKHKVVLFSDPLCPFCRKFVPEAIRYMKKYPHKFAIYYFHFPLDSIHPASVALTKAAVAAELQGVKDVTLKLYNVQVNAREKNITKILKAFNDVMNTNLKASDLEQPKVLEHTQADMDIATDMMVRGTPTMFFDSKLDKTKRKYKEVN